MEGGDCVAHVTINIHTMRGFDVKSLLLTHLNIHFLWSSFVVPFPYNPSCTIALNIFWIIQDFIFIPFSWYPIGSYSLVPSLQLPYGHGRGEGWEPIHPPKHNPAKPHCFLTQYLLSLEASRTNVSEETPCTWRPCQHALRPARHRSRLCAINIPAGQTLP